MLNKNKAYKVSVLKRNLKLINVAISGAEASGHYELLERFYDERTRLSIELQKAYDKDKDEE